MDKFENSFNPNFLAKVLRNEISDLVVYVEDAVDLDDFLFSKSGFRSAQQSKLLLFDANLRAPEFLKKAAAKLDGRISIAVTDVAKIAAKYQAKSDTIVLL